MIMLWHQDLQVKLKYKYYNLVMAVYNAYIYNILMVFFMVFLKVFKILNLDKMKYNMEM